MSGYNRAGEPTEGAAGRTNLVAGGMAVLAVMVITSLMLGGGPASMPAVFAGGLTLDAADAQSERTGRPVLLLVHADWCGPCQTLKRGALSDHALAGWIGEHTVPAAIDATSDWERASALGVRVLPTLMLRRDGRTIDVREGVSSATKLRRWLEAHAGPPADAAEAPTGPS